MLLVAPDRDLTPPRTVILWQKYLTVPPRQIGLGGVVAILHAAETVSELHCLASAHVKNNQLGTVLLARSGLHTARFSRKRAVVNYSAGFIATACDVLFFVPQVGTGDAGQMGRRHTSAPSDR